MIISHLVKCTVCGKQFDRDKIQAVKVSARRYAHYECSPDVGELVEMPQKDKDLVELEEFIKKIFETTYVHPNIRKQINSYVSEYNYSYSGILKSLKWFMEVENKPIEKSYNSIGIVPYIYDNALQYHYNLFLANEFNKQIKSYNNQTKVITISPPQREKKIPKLFNLEMEENHNE